MGRGEGFGGCCCGRPRKRPQASSVEERPELLVPSPQAPPPQGLRQQQVHAQSRPVIGAAMPPTSLQRRKPRSFDVAGSPKLVLARKPRSFGANGWLKVDLPIEGEAFACWYRRLRNTVTGGSVPSAAGLTAVVPGLYIGDKHDAADLGLLRRHGITHVLNCASAAETSTGVACYAESPGSGEVPIRYMELAATEGDGSELLKPHLKTAAAFINAALQVSQLCTPPSQPV